MCAPKARDELIGQDGLGDGAHGPADAGEDRSVQGGISAKVSEDRVQHLRAQTLGCKVATKRRLGVRTCGCRAGWMSSGSAGRQ